MILLGSKKQKKESFQDSFLNYVHKDFSWKALPAVGTAGGILVHFNSNKYDVLSCQVGSYSVAAMIKNGLNLFGD